VLNSNTVLSFSKCINCLLCCTYQVPLALSVSGYGRSSGGIACLIHNNHPTSDIVIVYQDVVPWYLRVYFHTLKIETFSSVPQHIDAVGSPLKPCNFNRFVFNKFLMSYFVHCCRLLCSNVKDN